MPEKYSTELPERQCKYGYTYPQLVEILGDRLPDFEQWMRGQTMMLCEGRKYNYDTKEYEPDCVESHGGIVYAWDLHRYLDGRPIID